MAVQETILQHWVVTQFILPLLLIVFIVYALLEKTKLLGEESHQMNAVVAFVLGLIFVSVVSPKLIVNNLILFLTIALVVLFVVLLLWGFVSGSDLSKNILTNNGVKWVVGIGLVIAVIIAIIWASGSWPDFYSLLFSKSWSGTFWINFVFVIVAGGALALIISQKGK